MKYFLIIISTIFFCSCISQKYELVNQTMLTNKIAIRDTIYLDTLIVDNENNLFVSKPWIVKPKTDEVLFLQIIKNVTKDTLEIQAKAGAGWVVPAYERIVNLNSHSKIFYRMLTTNLKGQINTTIDITYKRINSQDDLSKRIIVRLSGQKE